MNFLQKLKTEKIAREAYEQDERKLKDLIFTINNLHAIYDGEFLSKLNSFIDIYKQSKLNKQ